MIKTSSAKGKGRKWQNTVRDLILATFPHLGEGDVGSCSMGSGGIDIPMSPLAREALPISIECKKTKKHPAAAEMKQATANAHPDTIAAVAWCPHGSGPQDGMITFRLEDFLAWWERTEYMGTEDKE